MSEQAIEMEVCEEENQKRNEKPDTSAVKLGLSETKPSLSETKPSLSDIKPGLSAGKIFYKPGIIEEETDETSAYESSMADTPMLGGIVHSSSFLRPPQIHPSSSLHRIPTYSSSIGQSTVYRLDSCR
ncbi:hypothetical protein O0L34_g4816 [Tuta absoluta]|nr:hypothetical protein O0L34_g4816 [Tuta absoluta]